MSSGYLEQVLLTRKDGNSIYVSVFLPQTESERNKEAIIFCPPLYQERMWSQRVCNNFLRAASEMGYYGAYLHYYGVGDSDGDSEDLTIETMVEDVESVAEYMKNHKNVTTINLCGLRLGSAIASLYAERNSTRKVVFWAPVFSGQKYLYDMMKMCLSTQTVMFREVKMNRDAILESMKNGNQPIVDGYALNNIYGYLFSYKFYSQSKTVDLMANLPVNMEDLLIFDIGPMGTVGKDISTYISKIEEKGQGPAVTVDGIKEKKFWINEKHYKTIPSELFDKTLEWINR